MDFQQVGNRIVCANACFSTLGEGLIRLEWSASGQFEDRPTLMAITRPEPVPFAAVEFADGALRLSTGVIEIVYRPPGPFDENSLQIHWHCGHSGTWSPSTVDTQNLGGTFASLDLIHRLFKPEGVHAACIAQRYAHTQEWVYTPMKAAHQYLRDRGETTRFEDPPLWHLARHRGSELPPEVHAFLQEWQHFPPGLLSESGYSVLDDSDGAPLEAGTLSLRAERDGRDWYFFAYGSGYKQALADFTRLCGRIPMLPRWAFGIWFSLFDDMHEEDYRKLVERFAELELPLDVLILDVDWHLTGWCGWEWNRELFPDPRAFLRWAHNAGLHLGANVHIEGVPPGESRFDTLARARGLDPADVRAGKVFAVKNPTANWIFDSWQPDDSGSYKATATELEEGWLLFNLAEPEEARLFMQILHGPREEEGIDFWWIDGANATHPGVNSQLWTNHVYYTHLETANRRAIILSRTGGIGSHRYPAQFSADTYSHWEVLQLLVDFTARAGNVGVAYWSHDLGGFYGHVPGVPTVDPELFVRWVQFGCWSPLVRLHSDHGLREPWAYGRWVLEALQKAMRTRIEFVPYLYHLSRVAYDTGLPLCRPMYLGYPEESEAYRVPTQYLLGEGVLVAPVVEAGGYRRVWLPVGNWWERETHTCHSGPGHLDLWVRLDQVPVFIQAGTLLPLQPAGLRAGSAPSAVLVLEVYAGAAGELDFYEDDGESTEYRTEPGSRRRFAQHREDDRDILTCEPVRGSYVGMPGKRDIQIRWIGLTSRGVKVEGAQVGELNWVGEVLEVFLPMVSQSASWSLVVQSITPGTRPGACE